MENNHFSCAAALQSLFSFVRQKQVTVQPKGFKKTVPLALHSDDLNRPGAPEVLQRLQRIEQHYRGVNFHVLLVSPGDKGEMHIPCHHLVPMLQDLAVLVRGNERPVFATPWLNELLDLPAFNVGWVHQLSLQAGMSCLEESVRETLRTAAPELWALGVRPQASIHLTKTGVGCRSQLFIQHGETAENKELQLPIPDSTTLYEEVKRFLSARGDVVNHVRTFVRGAVSQKDIFPRARAQKDAGARAKLLVDSILGKLTESEKQLLRDHPRMVSNAFGIRSGI